jgi:hypothetical protein
MRKQSAYGRRQSQEGIAGRLEGNRTVASGQRQKAKDVRLQQCLGNYTAQRIESNKSMGKPKEARKAYAKNDLVLAVHSFRCLLSLSFFNRDAEGIAIASPASAWGLSLTSEQLVIHSAGNHSNTSLG